MIAFAAVAAYIAGWDAWIIRRDRRGVARTLWLDTYSGGVRTINRNPWRRGGLLVVLGALLYHLEVEQELHERFCPAGSTHPCP